MGSNDTERINFINYLKISRRKFENDMVPYWLAKEYKEQQVIEEFLKAYDLAVLEIRRLYYEDKS